MLVLTWGPMAEHEGALPATDGSVAPAEAAASLQVRPHGSVRRLRAGTHADDFRG